MALHGAGVAHTVNVSRALRPELVDMVIDQLISAPTIKLTQRKGAVRDTFIFSALRGLGLRASELVQSRMIAFYPLSVLATGKTRWVFRVTSETAEGGKARRIPVPKDVWTTFTRYRQAFGLPATPAADESGKLILSTCTRAVAIGADMIKETTSRRYFNAWREIGTRQGLYMIVTDR